MNKSKSLMWFFCCRHAIEIPQRKAFFLHFEQIRKSSTYRLHALWDAQTLSRSPNFGPKYTKYIFFLHCQRDIQLLLQHCIFTTNVPETVRRINTLPRSYNGNLRMTS